MWNMLLLPLMAAQALAQSTSVVASATSSGIVLQGTRSITFSEGIPVSATYIDYGTTIIYRVTDTASASNASFTGTASASGNSSSSAAAEQSSALLGTRTMAPANATGTQSAAQASNTVPCNGFPEFCNRKYSNITMITAHNSPFDIPNNVASNQDFGVIAQLNDGVRMVQGQTHMVSGVPHLCHTSCDLLDAGTLESWLANITQWLSANPYEVVTVLIGNGDYSPISDYTDALENSGIVNMAYVPPQIPMNLTSWPTLGSMILGGKRAVIFMDYNANQTAVPYVLDEFSQLSETPFDPTDASFPCTIQRPPDLSEDDTKNRLYMINHNLNTDLSILGFSISVPNLTNIATTNGLTGFTSAGLSANQCTCK